MRNIIVGAGLAAQPLLSELNLDNIWDPNNPNNNANNVPANAALISSITDPGRNPLNLAQASGGAQFTYNKNVDNGSSDFALAGGQYLTASETYVSNTPVSIVGLVKTSSIAAGTKTFLSIKSGSTGYGIGRNAAKAHFTPYGVQQYLTTNDVFAVGTWVVLGATWTPTNLKFYVNGLLFQTITTTASIGATAPLCLGSESSVTAMWTGNLNAVVRAMRALTDADHNLIGSILKARPV